MIFDLEDGLAHENKAVGRSNFADLANKTMKVKQKSFIAHQCFRY